MKRLKNDCPSVMHAVICQLHSALAVGDEVTDVKWNAAYKAVRALAIADTLAWKRAHLTKVSWQ